MNPIDSLARCLIRHTDLAMLLASRGRARRDGFLGVMHAQSHKLEQSLQQYCRIAQSNQCHLLATGFFWGDGQLVNRLWVINPRGYVVHTYDKQFLTDQEKLFGVAVGRCADPFFEIASTWFAAVICLDLFATEMRRHIGYQDVAAVLVPSANAQPWQAKTVRGLWQPKEWLDESAWVTNDPSRLLVNSMLRGNYGALAFDGQAFIRGPSGPVACVFPTDGRWLPPKIGFYPVHEGDFVYVDIT
jgi:predicted amidohydrolase